MRSADRNNDRISAGGILAAVLLGGAFYLLTRLNLQMLARTPLPEWFLTLWADWPRGGALAVSLINSLVSYWTVAAALGLVLALIVGREYLFYGAVATGAFLLFHSQLELDGWQSLLQVGPDFWLALKVATLKNDPFGVIARFIALPVCTWAWGVPLARRRDSARPSGG